MEKCSKKSQARLILTVKVIPGSSQLKITELGQRQYKVKLTAPPDKDKANRELEEVLAAHFKTSPKLVKIIKGRHSSQKLVALG